MEPQRQKRRISSLSSLNLAIDAVNLAKEVSSITPAKVVFGSVGVLLTMIRDSMANQLDYVELGLFCADICKALDRATDGRRLDEFSQSVCDAINQLKATVAEIQKRVTKRSTRNAVSRLIYAKNDGDAIAAWKLDLNRILHVFNTELAMNTHTVVVDIHQNLLKTREDVESQKMVVSDLGNQGIWNLTLTSRTSGELPPPPPRAHFGRGELVEEIICLAENLTPIALVGVGGIGKTSTALTVLHNDRIKQRFGDNRRFIRCDQFPASLTHFLHRLSKVIGAGVENPEDLAPLRPFLSSRDLFVVLDNAESILDPQGVNAQEIYAVVEELSQFSNICLCVTSRISAIPPTCDRFDIPTLSIEAARDTFYCIYKHGERSDLVNTILEQLDLHPLSITLLATVAHHNKWSADRLTREWKRRRTNVLHTQHNQSFAATIELSLASPMFRELGPDARGLLGVIAFFPQGIDENNVDWLFPAIPDAMNIFDNFYILSLTHRSNGFITMLGPLRGYLCPEDPKSSRLLCETKDHYFSRLSTDVDPTKPGFEKTRWMMSEDANIEHLLDVFTTIDENPISVWNACSRFMEHLYWHRPRLVLLGPRIEELPDNHPSKPRCLFELSRLLYSVGNHVESKRLFTHTLELWRERGDDHHVARTLVFLAEANRFLDLHKEGIHQANEGLAIHERLGDTMRQAQTLESLARLLYEDGQLDAAEEVASRAIDLSSNKGDQFPICQCHRLLGEICHTKGETERAIEYFETSLGIASSFNWHNEQFWSYFSLAEVFVDEGRFDDAHAHVERSKTCVVDGSYLLGHAMELQAHIWYRQHRFEEAKPEISCAAEVFEKLGAAQDLERTRELLRKIEAGMNDLIATHESDVDSQGSE